MAEFLKLTNLENKKKWVDALRSGEYKQGRGCLRNDDGGFCCLGVGADLAAKENGEVKWGDAVKHVSYTAIPLEYKDIFHTATPPMHLMKEFFGIEDNNPYMLVGSLTPEKQEEFSNWMQKSGMGSFEYDDETGARLVPLALLNDSGLFTFAELADLIEKDL